MSMRYLGGFITNSPIQPTSTVAKGSWTLQQQLQAIAASNWPLPPPSDPNFEYVTMLLNGDGTNGAQNNTFLDSSTNNFSITRNGNTTQGSFSPYGSNWSNFFGASGTYLNCGTSTNFQYGTGDFTIEMFVFHTDSGTQATYYGDTTGDSAGVYFYRNTSNQIGVYYGSQIVTASTAITANTWNHIAVARASGTIRLFLNGSQVGSASDSTNLTSTQIFIANDSLPSGQFLGYISNVRAIKGTALYTGSYTVPTAPLTAVSGTSLLTCQSNRFIDTSSTGATITPNGSPSVQRFSPFNPTAPYSTSVIGGSGYTGANGNYLSITNPLININDWTVEFWMYPLSYQNLFGIFGASNGGGAQPKVAWQVNGSNISLWVNGVVRTTSAQPTIGQWTHVAISRSSSTGLAYVYYNGILQTSGTVAAVTGITSGFQWFTNGEETQVGMTGYISNGRVSNIARYTGSNFTAPTAPQTADANTTFLSNFTNAGIPDLAMQNNLETVGNAQVSTSVVKYGTGSLAFDGSGDYLKSNPATKNLYEFGTGDFTIEMWAYFNAVNADQSLYDGRPTGTNGAYQHIYLEGATGKILYQANTSVQITATSALSASTWYHIALCRNGTSTKLFINGTQSGSTYTDSTNYTVDTGRPFIGVNASNTSVFNLNGYIDDMRITKGLARYTANFTPPTAALPTF